MQAERKESKAIRGELANVNIRIRDSKNSLNFAGDQVPPLLAFTLPWQEGVRKRHGGCAVG